MTFIEVTSLGDRKLLVNVDEIKSVQPLEKSTRLNFRSVSIENYQEVKESYDDIKKQIQDAQK
jgi:CRISPR/Cas system-associated protein Cas5 (RAMP superfamily)